MVTLAPRIAANFNMTLLDGSIRTNSLIKRVFADRKLGCCLGKYSLRFRIRPRLCPLLKHIGAITPKSTVSTQTRQAFFPEIDAQ